MISTDLVYQDHHARVARIVRAIIREDESEDVVQTVWLHVHMHLAGFRGDVDAGHWVYRIAVNACRDYIRRKTRRLAMLQCGEADADQSPSPLPWNTAKVLIQKELIASVMAGLSVADRECFLRLAGGDTYTELAAARGEPVSTVKVRLFRTRGKLTSRTRSDVGVRRRPDDPRRPVVSRHATAGPLISTV